MPTPPGRQPSEMQGDAALERLDAGEAPDLLISDLFMPGMDGLCLSWGTCHFLQCIFGGAVALHTEGSLHELPCQALNGGQSGVPAACAGLFLKSDEADRGPVTLGLMRIKHGQGLAAY